MNGHNPSTGHHLPYTYLRIVIGHNPSTGHHPRDWLRGHVLTKMNTHVTGHNPHDRSRGEMAKVRNVHPSDVNIEEGLMRPD